MGPTGQSVKAYFLHSLAPSSLLASSCSGPSRQVEPAPTARQIPCPGIGNDLPLPGRVVLPRALRFPPKEKRCQQRHKRKQKETFLGGFPPGTPVSTSVSKDLEKETSIIYLIKPT